MEHAEIEKIKADYLEAYRALWGEAAAADLSQDSESETQNPEA